LHQLGLPTPLRFIWSSILFILERELMKTSEE
jgi:hypothetical protein